MNPIISPQAAYTLAQADRSNELHLVRISEHFTWAEVFTGELAADIKACGAAIFANALRQAQTMEQVRAVFGKPIHVHCWYRSPAHNARVGGATHSYHLLALATDFHVEGFADAAGCLTVQKKLDLRPFMDACGLEWTSGAWVHVDSRGHRERFRG